MIIPLSVNEFQKSSIFLQKHSPNKHTRLWYTFWELVCRIFTRKFSTLKFYLPWTNRDQPLSWCTPYVGNIWNLRKNIVSINTSLTTVVIFGNHQFLYVSVYKKNSVTPNFSRSLENKFMDIKSDPYTYLQFSCIVLFLLFSV